MNTQTNTISIENDPMCREAFREAYENRYTWNVDFKGYSGLCCYKVNNQIKEQGSFNLSSDFKSSVFDIKDEEIKKSINSQLWEVAIHRVKRSFDQVHGKNNFTFGDSNDVGKEVILNSNTNGDRYRIKDKVVTMVHRHIHGKLISIFTKKVINTGNGYLSREYTSQYLDPLTGSPATPKSFFEDIFQPLHPEGPWVLTSRSISLDSTEKVDSKLQTFEFYSLLANKE